MFYFITQIYKMESSWEVTKFKTEQSILDFKIVDWSDEPTCHKEPAFF